MLKAREDDIKYKVQNWMSRSSEPRLQRISSELLNEYDSTELVASLLQELVEANDEVEVQLTFEKPLARKNRGNKGGFRRGNHKRSNSKFDNKNRRSKGSKGNSNKKKNSKKYDRRDKQNKGSKQTMKGRTFADLQK